MPLDSYCTDVQLLRFAVTANSLTALSSTIREAALSSASRYCDGYLGNQFTLPLVAWNDDLSQAVADIAAYRLLGTRGYNPSAGADIEVRARFEDTRDWLRLVADGKVTPMVTDSSAGASVGVSGNVPSVTTGSSRGWSTRRGGGTRDPGQFEGT